MVRAAAEAAERRARGDSRGRRWGEDGAVGAAPGMQGSRGAGRVKAEKARWGEVGGVR